ncbi:MAG: hypothetical protein ACFFE2_09125 [Candidatus Thorarchaeota archaeon]
MSTAFEFDNDAIESFCNNYGITISLTPEQIDKLGISGRTPLLIQQILSAVDQLFPADDSQREFVEQMASEFHPISLSLYVINDDLWKIMSRKHDYPDRMLPMTTIPWFYWEKNAEGRMNPSGIKRLSERNGPLTISFDKSFLKIRGQGGDFCGLLEGRIVDERKGIRPLIVPGETGPKKTVPNYESQFLQIILDTNKSNMRLYPKPMDELDYYYSEHPKVFYEHGILIEVDGEDVRLKVGRRKETTLRGKVIILIGKDFGELSNSGQIVMFHIWLSALSRAPFR